MSSRFLTALPVYNEQAHVEGVLEEVLRFSAEVLVVDDGSIDGTGELLGNRRDIRRIRHKKNRGYGAALRSAFDYAVDQGYERLVTIDCDGQHQPKRIGSFLNACEEADVVSGSRYLRTFSGDGAPPEARRQINQAITGRLNQQFFLDLTDAFCGFKAYRVEAISQLELTESGYGMPLEFWVQASHWGLRIRELAVPLIYLDEDRSFGGALDNACIRLEYYERVIRRATAAIHTSPGRLATS